MKTPTLDPAPERAIPRPAAPTVSEPSAGTPTPPVVPNRSAPGRASGWGSLIGWLVFLSLAVAGWYYSPLWWPWFSAHVLPTQAAPVKPAPRPTPVRTAVVSQESVNVYLDSLGTITAFNTVTVRSRVEGELINVAFTEGQMVKQGDLLAEIDPRQYETQRDQAKGKLVQDEAALTLAQATLDRQNELMKSNATTPQLIDQQVAVVNQARALLQIDKAIYENTLLQLEYCRITAPISGRIGLRLVDRGNMVRANDPNGLLIITQLEPIALVFTIPQDEIPRVQQRMKETETLTVDAYDRDFKTKLATGKLSAIDNQVDAATGTLRMKAMFENKDHILFPNQFVNARLLVRTISDAIVVPSVAVQRGPETMFVYVVKEDHSVELRPVTVGPVEDSLICIESGLKVGEIVVTDGLDKLQPNSKVTLPGESEKGAVKGEHPSGDVKPGKGSAPKLPSAPTSEQPTAPAKKSA